MGETLIIVGAMILSTLLWMTIGYFLYEVDK